MIVAFSTLAQHIDALYHQSIEDLIAQKNAENAAIRKAKMRAKRQRSPRGRYLHPKQQSIVVRLLDEIEARGGMRIKEIEKFLWEASYLDIPFDPKKGHGRWGTNLYGSGPSGGLLRTFCKKDGKKWVRNGKAHEGQPWKVRRREYNNRYKTAWARNSRWPNMPT